MGESCPNCGRPYGKRRRCYFCQPGRRRTGETRYCKQCGQPFYLEPNQIADTKRGTGSYCTQACKAAYLRGKTPKLARPDELLVHSAGYLMAWAPDHPRQHRGRVFQHILVAEQKLGRPLAPNEHVHHLDEDKQNNDPDNLLVLSNEEHQRYHVDHLNQKRHQVKSLKKRVAVLEIEAEYLRSEKKELEAEVAALRAQLKTPVLSS